MTKYRSNLPIKYTKLADDNIYAGVYTAMTLSGGNAQIWEQRDGLFMIEMTGEWVFRELNTTLHTEITDDLEYAKHRIETIIPQYISLMKQA